MVLGVAHLWDVHFASGRSPSGSAGRGGASECVWTSGNVSSSRVHLHDPPSHGRVHLHDSPFASSLLGTSFLWNEQAGGSSGSDHLPSAASPEASSRQFPTTSSHMSRGGRRAGSPRCPAGSLREHISSRSPLVPRHGGPAATSFFDRASSFAAEKADKDEDYSAPNAVEQAVETIPGIMGVRLKNAAYGLDYPSFDLQLRVWTKVLHERSVTVFVF